MNLIRILWIRVGWWGFKRFVLYHYTLRAKQLINICCVSAALYNAYLISGCHLTS